MNNAQVKTGTLEDELETFESAIIRRFNTNNYIGTGQIQQWPEDYSYSLTKIINNLVKAPPKKLEENWHDREYRELSFPKYILPLTLQPKPNSNPSSFIPKAAPEQKPSPFDLPKTPLPSFSSSPNDFSPYSALLSTLLKNPLEKEKLLPSIREDKLPSIIREDIRPGLDARLMLGGKEDPALVSELESFALNVPYHADANFLPKFVKDPARAAELTHYSIVRDSGRFSSRRFSERFYDVPYSFVLLYDSKPIASISFEAQEGAIIVSQIQGVHGQKDRLSQLKWERALLAAVFNWAQENGVPEVRVLPYHKNRWSNVSGNPRYNLIYDVTARRSGFTYDEEIGLYRKPTNPSYQGSGQNALLQPTLLSAR